MTNITKRAVIAICAVIVAPVLVVIMCPYWPDYFRSQPMFYEWVGASGTGWGRSVAFTDESGHWMLYDSKSNIAVIVCNSKEAQFPLKHISAANATFVVDESISMVDDRDRSKLVILAGKDRWEASVAPSAITELRKSFIDSYTGESVILHLVAFCDRTARIDLGGVREKLMEFSANQESRK